MANSNPNPQVSPEEMQKFKIANQMRDAQEKQAKLAQDLKSQIDSLTKKAEPFKKEIISKHKKEIVGVAVLPPRPPMPQQPGMPQQDIPNEPEILVLLEIKGDDLDEQFKKKQEIEKEILKVRDLKLKDVQINALMLAEVWDACYKGKYDVLNIITLGVPIHDTGWLGALRVVEFHKMQVLKKFEKYVVSYVMVGSMIRGEATETSDIDTFVVIDDTDVSRMTSQELKSKLTAIIWGMAGEAGMAAGVQNKLNVQIYLLTDMWDTIRNAHPVIFTMLRDGVPLYDRGMFTPWQMLLKKGKVRPSPEAVDSYIKSGKQILDRIKYKLKEIAIEDFFWATCTPAQGAMMLDGQEPPIPNKAAQEFREHFVKKRKLVEEKYAKYLEENIKLRKDLEHGTLKDVDAKVIDKHLTQSEEFLKRIDRLFKQLDREKVKDESEALYEKALEDVEADLKMVGIHETTDALNDFRAHLVDKKLASSRYLNLLNKIKEAKEKHNVGRETLASMAFEQTQFAKGVIENIRAEKGKNIEKFRVAVKYDKDKKTANLWLIEMKAYLVKDTADPKTPIIVYDIDKKGALVSPKKTSLDEINKIISTFEGTPAAMSEATVASLKSILGGEVSIIIGA